MSSKLEKYASENSEQTVALEDGFSILRYRQFSRHLPENTRSVIDIGCAEGRGGQELKSLRPSIKLLGLDCVEERLGALPACYDGKIHGLTTQIPLPDRSCDAIVAGEFLEHLYPSDVDPTLCEFQRVLEIGGTLMMTTPNPYSLKMRKRKGTVFGVAHLTQHFPAILKQRMMAHGFSRVKIIGSGQATRYFGEWMPYLSVYGSYLIIGKKI
ncbi:MAG: class I SAM-dependent methyltransferase [Akkermansiaceae bacterium]|jgi:ubiquinone/menaquinone biosynthesis C-methylase UbiE|nr:class I SAM-dependent methyltransferase [Akkermansiaceae bacterium]